MNMSIVYSVKDFINNKIPKEQLTNYTLTIILKDKVDRSICNIDDSIKCNFILQGSGHYVVYGKKTITIDGDNILLHVYDEVLVIEREEHENTTIHLNNNSSMIGYSSYNNKDETKLQYNNIILSDSSKITLRDMKYNIILHENSIGTIRGIKGQVNLHENSVLTLKDSMCDNVGEKIYISAYGNSKINGNVYTENIIINTHDQSEINIAGKCIINVSGSSIIRARGDININIRETFFSKIEAHKECVVTVDINNTVGRSTDIKKYVTDNVKVYGNSIIKYNSRSNQISNLEEWLNYYGVTIGNEYINNDEVILYKAVSVDYKTQERSANETIWLPGTVVEMPMDRWNPSGEECGPGKFHACAYPEDCLEFRSISGDRFIAIKVKKENLFLWTEYARKRFHSISYPSKIAFRKGEVLYECNINGEKIENK